MILLTCLYFYAKPQSHCLSKDPRAAHFMNTVLLKKMEKGRWKQLNSSDVAEACIRLQVSVSPDAPSCECVLMLVEHTGTHTGNGCGEGSLVVGGGKQVVLLGGGHILEVESRWVWQQVIQKHSLAVRNGRHNSEIDIMNRNYWKAVFLQIRLLTSTSCAECVCQSKAGKGLS